ncbi:MAG: DUF308 domain-containing protein [Ruminiclostridium sp.]|nr:DUF308 domain-containing protein [Ruminiclostridium sp.]MBQ8841580.1 DUF308 domain-containing protein [Ruminiclostridium sp.]
MKAKNYSAIIEDTLTETKALYLFICLVELVLGVFLMFFSEITSQILTIVLGAVLAGVGVFNIISYLMNTSSSFRQGILSGVISTALGIAFIAQAETIVNVTSIILGVFVIFEGLTCCKRSILMKKLDFDKWFIPLIIALLASVFGFLILIFPDFFEDAITIIVGILLAIESILGIWSIIFLISLRKKAEEKLTEDEKKAIVVK